MSSTANTTPPNIAYLAELMRTGETDVCISLARAVEYVRNKLVADEPPVTLTDLTTEVTLDGDGDVSGIAFRIDGKEAIAYIVPYYLYAEKPESEDPRINEACGVPAKDLQEALTRLLWN